MRLLVMHVQAHTGGGATRGVSVWVDAADATQARTLAVDHLADAGWSVLRIDSETETTADDYFRPCPSQQAFQRAQAAGVSWRFDDE
ncbi:MAG: hypothetical protein HY941_13725 [Gammaproteobacteria bacterium]|nr:hypothetical protein [Gammaproteobacteria bacterium]